MPGTAPHGGDLNLCKRDYLTLTTAVSLADSQPSPKAMGRVNG